MSFTEYPTQNQQYCEFFIPLVSRALRIGMQNQSDGNGNILVSCKVRQTSFLPLLLISCNCLQP